MNRLLVLFVAAGGLAGSGCATRGGVGDAASQILRLDAEWSQAAGERDVERVLSYWTDDATVFAPGGPPIVGKPAIREYVARNLQTPGFGITWKTTRVVVARSGELAYATGNNRVSFGGPDGRPVTVEGKAVTVWRKEPGGAWKCVIDIWNDVSPPSQ
jgi:ketosteroid isomerase-like protein